MREWSKCFGAVRKTVWLSWSYFTANAGVLGDWGLDGDVPEAVEILTEAVKESNVVGGESSVEQSRRACEVPEVYRMAPGSDRICFQPNEVSLVSRWSSRQYPASGAPCWALHILKWHFG